jgi:hypothetical protein
MKLPDLEWPFAVVMAVDCGRLAGLTEPLHFPPRVQAVQDKSDAKGQKQNQNQRCNAHDRAPVVVPGRHPNKKLVRDYDPMQIKVGSCKNLTVLTPRW